MSIYHTKRYGDVFELLCFQVTTNFWRFYIQDQQIKTLYWQVKLQLGFAAKHKTAAFLAYWPIGHNLFAWPGVGIGGGIVNNFSSLFSSETTAQNTSKLYIQLPYMGVYKNSSFHVDLIVDVDFIGLWKF